VTTANAAGTVAAPTAPTTLESTKPADATTTSSQEAAESEEEGLSKSDIIALATGLGIGIPSLIVGVVALVIQIRKRRANAEPSESYTHIMQSLTPPTQSTPQSSEQLIYQASHQASLQSLSHPGGDIYELGERAIRRT
jgi:hypothetical protein